MLTLKEIRKTKLYKALMEIPGVELMEIDKELQAVDSTKACNLDCDLMQGRLLAAFTWSDSPQGHYFWLELHRAKVGHCE